MQRFTTDTPNGNLETMMNFAYAKNGEVWLRGADDGKDAELCAYIAKRAFYLELCGITNKDDVIEACGAADCFCELGALFAAATQAAELRARLAAYEDTELEPEEVERYAKAEKDGRLLVPPCKVGDTVFFAFENEYIFCGKVSAISTCDGTNWFSVRYDSGLRYDHTWDEIGKTAFLTREDAEKALEVMKNDER